MKFSFKDTHGSVHVYPPGVELSGEAPLKCIIKEAHLISRGDDREEYIARRIEYIYLMLNGYEKGLKILREA